MSPVYSDGPFETDPHSMPVHLGQVYHEPIDLGLDNVAVPAAPGSVVSNRFDAECWRSLTFWGTHVAGGFSTTVYLGFYDIDDATLLTRVAFWGFMGAGATFAIDIGTGSAGAFQGRVWRTLDVELVRGGGAAPGSTVTVWVWGRR